MINSLAAVAMLLAVPSAPRTITVAIEANRDSARVVDWSIKDRPPLHAWYGIAGENPVFTVVLESASMTQIEQIETPGLCVEHGPETPNHEVVLPAGYDQTMPGHIRLHQETFLVELPLPDEPATISIRLDGRELDREQIDFSNPPTTSELTTPGTVHWPEEFGETEKYRVIGNEAEIDRRFNVVIVPEGYRHDEKATLDANTDALVAKMNLTPPYREHAMFINYILVYAYSTESGTDQCDCGIVMDTAMNTRFPESVPVCGDSSNRCLYYGTANGGPNCDENTSTTNIVAAELRAPARDSTVIMVNTARYGGCGGARAVYSAGASGAELIALHEEGHVIPSPGLADEYAYSLGCGSGRAPNVCDNTLPPCWPEWIPELGQPREGAKYWQQCLFRPWDTCMMKELAAPFCAVCIQHFSLSLFGNPRISPTAPISSAFPMSPVFATVGTPATFTIQTRLGTAPYQITWKVDGVAIPGCDHATICSHVFPVEGTYDVTVEVIADSSFIKREKDAANKESASWSVVVTACIPAPEICSDAIDNDCDTAIDCADTDCLLEPSCCKTSGSSCASSPECCSGLACTNGKCMPPCKVSGSCSTGTECCSGVCRRRQCTAPPPPCKVSGSPCTSGSECCSGSCSKKTKRCA